MNQGKTLQDEKEEWWCKNCPLDRDGKSCGPWESGSDIFTSCKKIHQTHQGWELYDSKKIQDENKSEFDLSSAKLLSEGYRINRFKEMKNDITFTVNYNGKKIIFEPLEKEIKKLRPLSVHDKVVWVLIFLPVRGTVTTDGKHSHTTYFQTNYPYYINSKKELWVAKDENINEEFQLPELSLGEKVRWNSIDVLDYIETEEKINLKALFEKIIQQVKSLIELKDENYLNVFVLWAIGTYFYRFFEYYPYLDFSGSKGSGKTKALVILLCLCYNARLSHKITGPNWARNVDALNCTILIDEQEDLNDPRTEHAINLVTLLNSAFRTDADQSISIPIKDIGWGSKTFDIGVPVAIGHITPLNDVTEDRSIPMKMIVSRNKKILDAEVEQNNPIWNELRDKVYRAYLDYFDEVIKIKQEPVGLPNITARERNQICKPIIALARLFERHGIVGLENSVKLVVQDVHEIKTLNNQTNNRDIQVLEKLCEFFVDGKISEVSDKPNHKNWYRQQLILDEIIHEDSELSSISAKELGACLDRLQIQRRKKNPFNTCVYFDRQILVNLCQRYDLDYEALSAQSSLQTYGPQEQSAASDKSAQSEKIDNQEYCASNTQSQNNAIEHNEHIEHKSEES